MRMLPSIMYLKIAVLLLKHVYLWLICFYMKMNIEELRDYCISKKAVTEEFPFDDVTLVFKVMGKMFVCVDLDNPELVTMKCEPEYAMDLREHYDGIDGAFHFNKKYWNQVSMKSDVDDSLVRHLIDHSYDEVIKKFTRKMRAEYDDFAPL